MASAVADSVSGGFVSPSPAHAGKASRWAADFGQSFHLWRRILK
jgi:hypothetical protein